MTSPTRLVGLLALFIGCSFLAGGCRATNGAKGSTPTEKRTVITAETQKTLDELYATKPEAKEKVANGAGYDTLGGFVTTTLGRIPEAGTEFEYDGAKFTVLDAEPQKVNRVRIDVIPQPAEETMESAPTGM